MSLMKIINETKDNGGWPERDDIPVDSDPIGDVAEYPKFSGYKPIEVLGKFEATEIKCDCGTEATYGKVPKNAHSHYCKLLE